ncbi:helix-turn-helix domain-containing protein [Cohnella fermenti]|nr:helix-turn-helix domain-containing protein [Cohnella fermenti]
MQENTLLLIVEGRVEWRINGQSQVLERGSLLGAEANCLVESVVSAASPLRGWKLTFSLFQLSSISPVIQQAHLVNWHAPGAKSHCLQSLEEDELLAVERELEQVTRNVDLDAIVLQAVCGRLMLLLHKKQQMLSQRPELEQAALHMKRQYHAAITREQLASLAGLSVWHFSRKFKDEYGETPMDYLSRIRMMRAQEHLIAGVRVQEAARLSGFADVFYFSKRFKQSIGIAPSGYMETIDTRRIAATSSLLAEYLLSLGIVPRLVLAYIPLVANHQSELMDRYQVTMLDSPQYSDCATALSPHSPELIIAHQMTESERESLGALAPVIHAFTNDCRSLLARLSGLFNKREAAARQLKSMEGIARSARQQLMACGGSDETVLILRVESSGYRYVNSRRGFGASSIIYGDLNLKLPPGLDTDRAACTPITPDELARANPDHLFIEKRVSQEGGADRMMEQLQSHARWRDIAAVRHGRVYPVTTRLWVNGCGPVGYGEIIAQAVSCITAHNCPSHCTQSDMEQGR